LDVNKEFKIMKISKIFVAILALCAFIACEPNNNNNGGGGVDDIWGDNGSPVGEWTLTEWNSSRDLPFGVYISLNEDNTFDLYQHTSDVLWVHYTGTYTLNGSTLSGVYSDGVSWATDYTIKYNKAADPKQISLTSTGNVGIYTATTIPDTVIDQATEAGVVRSGEVKRFL
jgi:hypothetical protein